MARSAHWCHSRGLRPTLRRSQCIAGEEARAGQEPSSKLIGTGPSNILVSHPHCQKNHRTVFHQFSNLPSVVLLITQKLMSSASWSSINILAFCSLLFPEHYINWTVQLTRRKAISYENLALLACCWMAKCRMKHNTTWFWSHRTKPCEQRRHADHWARGP
jgi:hypothetical protein